MRLFKSKGIVFRTAKFSETSLIADIYTKERGLRSFIISGVRKQKSRISAGLFQLMNIVDIVAYDKDNDTLSRLKEVKLAHMYQKIPFDVVRSSLGTFMIEVCRNSIREKEANPELFEFLCDWFVYLDGTEGKISNLHLRFLLELAAQIGFKPDSDYQKDALFDVEQGCFIAPEKESKYSLDTDTSACISSLMKTLRNELHLLPIDRKMRNNIVDGLIDFYRFHVEHFRELKSLAVLREIL